MSKNTVTGSFFAKMFPTASKWFLENASQDDVLKAEQEAAVLHQQLQATEVPAPAVPAAPAAVTTPATPVAQMPLEIPAPQPSASELTSQLTAMTTRATSAESQVTALTNQLTAAASERDRYKAWHDKHKTLATALPASDLANKDQDQDANLSTASSSALAQFRKSKGLA